MCKQETKYYNHMKQATYTFVYFNPRIFYVENATLWLRQLVSGLLLHRHGFNPKAAHVGFVVDIATLGQGSSQVLLFSCQDYSNKHPYSHSTSLTYHQLYTIITSNNIIQKHWLTRRKYLNYDQHYVTAVSESNANKNGH